MKTRSIFALGALLIAAATGSLQAAGDKRASPHEATSATVGGKKITIEYGRPFKKGRTIFGDKSKGALVPFGEVWRTGADEATTLTTDGELTIGRLTVPKGTYSLFTIPGDKEWTLVVNKTSKQWGAYQYDAKQDLGRTPMKAAAAAAPVEQFTIIVEPQGKGGTLKLAWDTTVVTAPSPHRPRAAASRTCPVRGREGATWDA